MIFNLRKLPFILPLVFGLGYGLAAAPILSSPAEAQARAKGKKAKTVKRANTRKSRRSRTSAKSKGSSSSGAGGRLVQTYGNWSTYVATAPTKTCYAGAQPRKREPARLKRDPGYFLISTRPRQGIRNEIAIILGFAAKAGSEPEVRIGSAKFEMIANGANLWIKNAAEEGRLLNAMRKGATMTVHVTSGRGNETVDHYSLSGVTQAIARARKECR